MSSQSEQILEMDDDEDDREFSTSIVFDFFDQAEKTFKNLDKALYISPSFVLIHHISEVICFDVRKLKTHRADTFPARRKTLSSCPP
jgi:hypothetical protein